MASVTAADLNSEASTSSAVEIEKTNLVVGTVDIPEEVPLKTIETSKKHEIVRKTKVRQTSMATYIPKRVTPKCKQIIDEKLLRLFTDTYQPFRIVEETAFRHFVFALNPSYELPSRHAISRTMLPAMYEKCVTETTEVLNIAKKVCITTDCWTSVNMESFMAVTAHFLNDNFQPISLLLDCSNFSAQHTAANLAKELNNVVTEWKIKDKLLMVVSDNAANIKAAINSLRWKHYGCFAHTVNLVVSDGLKDEEVINLIARVKYIVGHFKRSHVATAKLIAYQQNQGTKTPLKLLQDVSTRWNSTFYMLERLIVLEESVKATMSIINMELKHHLTMEEWIIVKQLAQILKPFESVTKNISGEEYLTASMVIPLVNGLNSALTKFENRPFADCVKRILERLKKSLTERLGNSENSNTLSIATFLDPRFKEIPFKDKKNAEIAKKNIISLVAEKFSAELVSRNASGRSESLSTSIEAKNDNKDDDDIWEDFEKEAETYQPVGVGTSTTKAILEVQRFLDFERLPRNQDALKWWRENKYLFPHLTSVAQERLSVCVTSVPCERQFSKAGQILTDRRSRLSSKKAKMLLFLNSNLKTTCKQ